MVGINYMANKCKCKCECKCECDGDGHGECDGGIICDNVMVWYVWYVWYEMK